MYIAIGEYSGPLRAKPFIAYCQAKARQREQRQSFMAYVADSLWLYCENKRFSRMWSETLTQRKETKSAEQIISSLIEGGALEVTDSESIGPSS